MFLPDLPVSVAFGSLIVASQVRSHLDGEAVDPSAIAALRRRSFWQTLVYGACFHVPDSVTAFVWYPDWNLAYLVPWERVGWLGVVVMEAILFGLLFAGRALSLALLERGRRRLVLAPAVAAALVFAVVMGVVFDRYLAERDRVFDMFSTLAGMYLVVPLLVLLGYNHFRPRPR